MNCDQVKEYLPWYLNGTLEDEERSEIARHLATCSDCLQQVAATRDAFEIFDAHLPAGVLIELVEGRPPSIPAELALRHLGACPHCSSDLEIVRRSREAMEMAGAAAVPTGASETASAVVTPFAPRPRSFPAPSRLSPFLAVAAGLAAMVFAAGWSWTARISSERAEMVADLQSRIEAPLPTPETGFGEQLTTAQRQIAELRELQNELSGRLEQEEQQQAELRRDLARATAPQLNVAVIDLFPAGALTRGGPDRSPGPRLARDAGAVLILNSQSMAGDGPVRVEMRDAAGQLVWSLQGLRRNPTGDFTLTLPVSALPVGDYELLLIPSEPGAEPEFYPFRVE